MFMKMFLVRIPCFEKNPGGQCIGVGKHLLLSSLSCLPKPEGHLPLGNSCPYYYGQIQADSYLHCPNYNYLNSDGMHNTYPGLLTLLVSTSTQ